MDEKLFFFSKGNRDVFYLTIGKTGVFKDNPVTRNLD